MIWIKKRETFRCIKRKENYDNYSDLVTLELMDSRMTSYRSQDPMIKGRRRALRWRLLRFGVGFPSGPPFSLLLSVSLTLFVGPPVSDPWDRHDALPYQNESGDDQFHRLSFIPVKFKDALDNPIFIRVYIVYRQLILENKLT